MNYTGNSRKARVRIVAATGHWKDYNGQECDATIYEADVQPQLDTEQLKPPLPRWQSVPLSWLKEIK